MLPYGDNFHHNFDMIFRCFPSSVETDLFLQREVPFPRFSQLDKYWTHPRGGGGELPYEEYMRVCHELGSHFQEKIPKRVYQFFAKISERAIISIRNSR